MALASGQTADAVRNFRVALAAGPVDRASAHADLAEGLLRAGDRAEAKRQALLALEIAPTFELQERSASWWTDHDRTLWTRRRPATIALIAGVILALGPAIVSLLSRQITVPPDDRFAGLQCDVRPDQ